MRELLPLWLLKWYTVRIRTRLGIYGQIYPFAFRGSLELRPRELLQAKGYIWPYIPPLFLIRIHTIFSLPKLSSMEERKYHVFTSNLQGIWSKLSIHCIMSLATVMRKWNFTVNVVTLKYWIYGIVNNFCVAIKWNQLPSCHRYNWTSMHFCKYLTDPV